MNSSFAIAIPVYNNVTQFCECLKSLAMQNVKNFDVHIYDDASTQDYKPLLTIFSELNVHYLLNEKNLGALANMQYAYNNLKNRYDLIMVMHEDDILHQNFVEAIYYSLQDGRIPDFIISNFKEFSDETELKKNVQTIKSTIAHSKISKKDLCFLVLKGQPLAFGSVVYNAKVFEQMNLDLNTYAEFADRPFLLNGLTDKAEVVVLAAPLYYYRSHTVSDTRWKKLGAKHIFNLLKLYHSILVESKFLSVSLFKKYATGFVFESYKNLLLTKAAPSFISYLLMAGSKDLLSVKYSLFRVPFINKSSTFFKKFFN